MFSSLKILKFTFNNFNSSRLFCHEIVDGIQVYSYRHKHKVPLVLKNPLYSSWYTW